MLSYKNNFLTVKDITDMEEGDTIYFIIVDTSKCNNLNVNIVDKKTLTKIFKFASFTKVKGIYGKWKFKDRPDLIFNRCFDIYDEKEEIWNTPKKKNFQSLNLNNEILGYRKHKIMLVS